VTATTTTTPARTITRLTKPTRKKCFRCAGRPTHQGSEGGRRVHIGCWFCLSKWAAR